MAPRGIRKGWEPLRWFNILKFDLRPGRRYLFFLVPRDSERFLCIHGRFGAGMRATIVRGRTRRPGAPLCVGGKWSALPPQVAGKRARAVHRPRTVSSCPPSLGATPWAASVRHRPTVPAASASGRRALPPREPRRTARGRGGCRACAADPGAECQRQLRWLPGGAGLGAGASTSHRAGLGVCGG